VGSAGAFSIFSLKHERKQHPPGNRHSSARGNKAFSVEVIIQRDDRDEIGHQRLLIRSFAPPARCRGGARTTVAPGHLLQCREAIQFQGG